MKKEIQMILDHFEKDNDLIIVNNNNFELFNTLPKIKSVNRLHVKFKCKRCNSIVTRRADTFFKFPFICKNCISKEVHNNPEVRRKTEETCLARYGVKHNWASKELREKGQYKTCLEKYGNRNYNNQEKLHETNIKKYGENYREIFHEKSIQTCLEKYNKPWSNNLEKMYNTNIERYGDKCSLNNKEISDKRSKTWLENYGVNHPWKASIVREKQFNTCMEKYNSVSPQFKYNYDNKWFDSSWEVAFYIYLKDHNIRFEYHTEKFEYYWNNKKHYYFPDFKVFNTFVEIKSKFLYEKMLIENTKDAAKYDCMKKHNVKIIINCDKYLDYVNFKYGINFLNSLNKKQMLIS